MMNKKQTLAIVGVVLIVVSAALIIYQVRSAGGSKPVTKAFYTVDDGQNWFADSSERLPPFDHEGKQAVRAYVFRYGSGKPFVGYLERFTENAKKQLEKIPAPSSQSPDKAPSFEQQSFVNQIKAAGSEIKKPGGNRWYSSQNAPAEAIAMPIPEGGKREDLEVCVP